MTAIQLRRARTDDAETLARLRYRFRAEMGPVGEAEAAFLERATAWFAMHLAEPDWLGWVALVDADLVGHVFVHLVGKIPNPGAEAERLAYLTNLYVRPQDRRRGIGERLLEAARTSCAVAGVETIFLRPAKGSTAFYDRCGYRCSTFVERLPD